jgi:hypothetical protein
MVRSGIGDFVLKIAVLPAYACALHPSMACWAWSGRSSKLAIRSISSETESSAAPNENGDGESSGSVGHGLLGGGSTKIIDTGKGKFGMDLKFVGVACFIHYPADWARHSHLTVNP